MDLQQASKDYTRAIQQLRPILRQAIDACVRMGLPAEAMWERLGEEVMDATALVCGRHRDTPLRFKQVAGYIRYTCPRQSPKSTTSYPVAVVSARPPLGPPPGYIEPTEQEMLDYCPPMAFPPGRALVLLGKGSPNVPGTVTFTREEVAYLRRCFEAHAESWTFECKLFQKHWADAYEAQAGAGFWQRHAEELQQLLNQIQAESVHKDQLLNDYREAAANGLPLTNEERELADDLVGLAAHLIEERERYGLPDHVGEHPIPLSGDLVGEGEAPTTNETNDDPDDDST